MSAPGRSGAVLALLVATLVVTAGAGVAWAVWNTSTRLTGSATAAFRLPVIQRVPHVTGTPVDLETLTAVDALWDGLAPSATRARQWFGCNAALGSCTAIAGATGASFTVPAGAAVAGTRYVLRERVTNGPNVVDAVSVPTDQQTTGSVVLGLLITYALVASPAPVVTAPSPVRVGSSLTVTSGTWQGRSLLGDGLALGSRVYAYQWLRCGPVGHNGTPTATTAACVNATGTGATTATYVPNAADVGQRLRVRVSASAAQAVGTTATGRLISQATTVVAP